MQIKYLGHAAFRITSDTGVTIITDPYTHDDYLKYDEIKESADIVTVSHNHADHNNVAAVQGNPKVIDGTTEAKGIEFTSIPTYHDDGKGQQRGKNTVFCFKVDGIGVCHLGDLGHQLDDKQIAELGKVDILLIPVGGFYTIDAKVAGQVSNRITPKLIIPMHYKTAKCNYPIASLDEFIRGKSNIKRANASEIEIKREELPTTTQIIVMESHY